MARLVLLDTSYLYTEAAGRESALNIASKFLDKNDGVKRTISSFIMVPSLYSVTGKTSVKTDFAISKPKTPSLYVANFKDKKGFVILSADKRAHEVLAMVGSGTVDSLSHIGLRIFLENCVKHIDEKVAALESLRGDVIFKSMVAKLEGSLKQKQTAAKPNTDGGRIAPCLQPVLFVPGAVAPTCGGCVANVSTYPISSMNVTNYVALPLLKTQWDQGPPFNNGQPFAGCSSSGYCGTNSNYLAGCVAVAEGQVVAYFGAKKSQAWLDIVNARIGCSLNPMQSNIVSTTLHNIYLDYGIYVSRTCGATGAGGDIGDIHLTNPRGISPSRGLVQGEWRSWNTGDIRNSLAGGSPVVISGTSQLCCFIFCWGCGAGHEWVIDGMKDIGVQTTYQTTTTHTGTSCPPNTTSTYYSTTVTATQIHQNWGWGPFMGSDPNDWYAQDVFQSSAGGNNYGHANYIVAYITSL